jgi:adenylate cyclase
MVAALAFSGRNRESTQLASEQAELLDAIGDPDLSLALLTTSAYAKVETVEMAKALQWTQRVIDLADGDPTKGALMLSSPLVWAHAFRGMARCSLGIPGWREDLQQAVTLARAVDPLAQAVAMLLRYAAPIVFGTLLPDDSALRETAETLGITQRSGDKVALTYAQYSRGVATLDDDGPGRAAALKLMTVARDAAAQHRINWELMPLVDIQFAMEHQRDGDYDGAIELARTVIGQLDTAGHKWFRGLATTALVDALLARGADDDLAEAHTAIETLAAIPTDPGLVLFELPLLRLRAALAQAHGDQTTYRNFRDRYRKMATELGFEGHIVWADAMP